MNNLKKLIYKRLIKLLALFPIKHNKVLFISFYGNHCDDNPRAISDQLYSEFGNKVDIVWGLDRKKISKLNIPTYARIVKYGTIRYLYELATSRIWVNNNRKREWERKRKNQYYIQTWHGNLGNKRVEQAAIETLSSDYVYCAKQDAKDTNLMISGSDLFTKLIKDYFWYNGEILECGTPRLDNFFNKTSEDILKIKQKLNISPETNCILYAPTFRANGNTEVYNIDFEKVIETLEQKTNKKWNFLIRLHPTIAGKSNFIEYKKNIINVTNYDDLYELIPASEIIISDYSSLTFEAMLLDKPIFLYATDLDEYIKERGFYIDIHDLPFILTQSNEELLEKINNFNQEDYLNGIHCFIKKLGIKEKGNASKIIAERIMQIINN